MGDPRDWGARDHHAPSVVDLVLLITGFDLAPSSGGHHILMLGLHQKIFTGSDLKLKVFSTSRSFTGVVVRSRHPDR